MRTIVVTGATSGIGLEAAVHLAQDGEHLVLVGRSADKLTAAAARVEAAGAGQVDTHVADQSSLEAVQRLADDLSAGLERIDVLLANAGTVYASRTVTVDGYEATFAVNHLAPFLLVEGLKELLVASAPSRIVITASTGHHRGTMDFDDLEFEHGYQIMRAYSRSKLANVLYTRHLAAELDGTGVTVNCLHPGTIATDIWSGAPWFARPALAVAKRVMMTSPEEGGRRLALMATDPAYASVTGAYVDETRVAEPSALARDKAVGDRLVAVSRDMVGLG